MIGIETIYNGVNITNVNWLNYIYLWVALGISIFNIILPIENIYKYFQRNKVEDLA